MSIETASGHSATDNSPLPDSRPKSIANSYPRTDRFNVSRRPRGHLAFGHGVHFCLGAALARLEARVAFETLLEIANAPSLVDDDVAWIDPLTLRGPKHLRVLC